MASQPSDISDLPENRRYVVIELVPEAGQTVQGYGVALAEFTKSALRPPLKSGLTGHLCLTTEDGDEFLTGNIPIFPSLIVGEPQDRQTVIRAAETAIMNDKKLPVVFGRYWPNLHAKYFHPVHPPPLPTPTTPSMQLPKPPPGLEEHPRPSQFSLERLPGTVDMVSLYIYFHMHCIACFQLPN